MELFLVKMMLVGLLLRSCESSTKDLKQSVETAPNVEEIKKSPSYRDPDEIPLLVETLDKKHDSLATDVSSRELNDPEDLGIPADDVVFRPLFGYRSHVERRSTAYRRQNRRGEATSSGGYSNYFSNPPPYLVYDRKSGAYHPYYYYPNNNARRG